MAENTHLAICSSSLAVKGEPSLWDSHSYTCSKMKTDEGAGRLNFPDTERCNSERLVRYTDTQRNTAHGRIASLARRGGSVCCLGGGGGGGGEGGGGERLEGGVEGGVRLRREGVESATLEQVRAREVQRVHAHVTIWEV